MDAHSRRRRQNQKSVTHKKTITANTLTKSSRDTTKQYCLRKHIRSRSSYIKTTSRNQIREVRLKTLDIWDRFDEVVMTIELGSLDFFLNLASAKILGSQNLRALSLQEYGIRSQKIEMRSTHLIHRMLKICNFSIIVEQRCRNRKTVRYVYVCMYVCM